MKEICFHEDFYCQVELLPVAALKDCASEMQQIDDFSTEHWDGAGWTSIVVRQDNSGYLRALGIPINALAEKLDSILDSIDEIYTGYSSYRERCAQTKGWAFPCGCALLTDYDSEGIVRNLWLVNEPPSPQSFDKFKEAVQVLSQYGEFLIADWNLSVAVACVDDEKLRKYFVSPIDETD